MPQPRIRLERMTNEELESYLAESIPRYAEGHVRDGQWTEDEALARSKAEHDQLLPQGIATPHHYLWTIIEEDSSQRVGELWYHLRVGVGNPTVWIYWIGIHPSFRRRGLASRALQRVEEEARKLGASRVGLHVFGENLEAQRLYERLGYAPTNVIMAKELPSDTVPV